MTDYLIQGFKLLNKNIELFFISAIFSLILLLDDFSPKLSSIAEILFFITLIPSLAYQISIPQFLVHKQKGEKLSNHYFWRVLWKNSKRLLIPGLIFFVLMLISIILLIFISAVMLEKQNFSNIFEKWGNHSLDPLSTTHMVLNIFSSSIGALLIFSSIFFSVEKMGLLGSFRKSVIFSFKNISYIFVVFTISYITYFINTFIETIPRIGLLISSLFYGYVCLIILTSSLVYYQKYYKKKI